jgi:hypothetical protein
MADAFAHAHVQPTFPLALQAPWPDPSRTFAPGGFIPAAGKPAAASPICAPGFSLLLTPFAWIARDGIFLVTPMAAAVLVWCAFLVGRHLGGPVAGAFASVAIATSPIVLFQAMQPMNDIATTALWMAVLAAAATLEEPRRSWVMGALTGAAILVRPNRRRRARTQRAVSRSHGAWRADCSSAQLGVVRPSRAAWIRQHPSAVRR